MPTQHFLKRLNITTIAAEEFLILVKRLRNHSHTFHNVNRNYTMFQT